MAERILKIGRQFRDFSIKKSDIDVEKRTVALSFSSETEEVQRYFGVEILDHSPGACDLSRLKKGGALLIDHDPRNQVGKIEEATVGADRKGRARVRFGRSAKAEEIFQDVVDEIKENVSCGYEPLEMVLERQQENGPDVYRVTKWMPFEISLVSIPADTSVGVGRSEGASNEQGVREIKVIIPDKEARADEMQKPECHSKDMEPMKPEDCTMGKDCENARCSEAKKAPRSQIIKETRKMADKKICDACGIDMVDGKCPNPKHEDVERALARMKHMSGEEMEKVRKQAIKNLCDIYKMPENYRDMWIGQGLSTEQTIEEIRKVSDERIRNSKPETLIGLSPVETNRFSLIKAVRAISDNNWKDASYELEVSRAVAQKMNRLSEPTKFFVPYEVLTRPRAGAQGGHYRDATAGTTSAGGYLVETQNQGFIEQLYNRSVCFKMGARRLSGLTGNVTIPRQSGGSTAYWLTNEATQATETNLTFAQVSLTPKNVAAYVEISRQLMMQSSPGAEGIVSDDLAKQVAIAADLAGLEGGGGAQPTGIASTASIGDFTGATLGYAALLNAQEDLATANISPQRGGYVATPAVASLCMQRVKFTSTASPLWEGNLWDGNMAGFPAMSSNQLTAATMIFGDWQELVMAEWGVLEVEVNPFANFQAGVVGVRAMYSMDAAVRRAAAFTRATSIT